jgi:hypothetical protein
LRHLSRAFPDGKSAHIFAGGTGNTPPSSSLFSMRYEQQEQQTGTAQDTTKLTNGELRTICSVMFMLAYVLISKDTEWAKIYQRLVLKKCPYDARTRRRTGKKVVLGRIAGQMIKLIYKLLKTDHEVLLNLKPGEIPPPILYDLAIHKQHREGKYILQPKTKHKTTLEILESMISPNLD